MHVSFVSRLSLGLLILFVANSLSASPSPATELDGLRAQVAAQEQRIAELEQLVRRLLPVVDTVVGPEIPASGPVARTEAQAVSVQSANPAISLPPQSKPKGTLKWYGFVKVSASYDTQQVHTGNLGYFVRQVDRADRRGDFNLTARETRIGLKWDELEAAFPLSGLIEADFYGSSGETVAAPRLRLAYLDVTAGQWRFRAGQDWDTVVLFHPRTVNFGLMGTGGHLWGRRPIARATRVFGDPASNVSASVGVARPNEQGDDLPTFESRILWERKMRGRMFTFGVSGSFGQESVATHLDDFRSRVIVVGARIPLTDSIRLSGNFWAGENLSRWQGGVQQGINLDAGVSIASHGGWLQMELPVTEKVTFALGGGFDNPADGDLSPGMRSHNRHLSGSFFYEVSPRWCLMSEYTHLQTGYKDQATEQSHRVQGAVQLGF